MDGLDLLTGAFSPGAFVGRMEVVDRFLSNFNKPLRRRMLFSAPDVVFPESKTFRHPGTGDVYLLGQSRSDAIAGQPHLQLTVCHLVTNVTNGSAGLATLYRKTPVGPESDPGWLVEQEVTKGFIDLEFRTSSNEADTYELKIGNYYAFMPSYVQAEEWDFVELNGTRYRVVDAFSDSGMTGLRVDKEEDARGDFLLHHAGVRTYNRTTHAYEVISTPYQVTGVILKDHEFANWASDSEPYIDVSIEKAHIGVAPLPNTMSLEIAGRRRIIRQVTTAILDRQYRLRCE
jgi:hypothetical protein